MGVLNEKRCKTLNYKISIKMNRIICYYILHQMNQVYTNPLPCVLHDLTSEYNAEHREKMKIV